MISDADLSNFALQYGTPLYVYSLPAMREAISRLRRELPQPHRLYYSMKANPHPEILRTAVNEGLYLEASSPPEASLALSTSENVLATGPGKTDSSINRMIQAGVRRFTVESPLEHKRLRGVARQSGVPVGFLVRLNAPDDARASWKMGGQASQFGVDLRQTELLSSVCRSDDWAKFQGFQLFSASNVLDTESLVMSITSSVRAAAEAASLASVTVSELDLGGGFPAPFGQRAVAPNLSGLGDKVSDELDINFPGWRIGSPVVSFESGRAVSASAGTLLTTVQDRKSSRGREFAVLDSGINHLAGMSGTGRSLLPRLSPRTIHETKLAKREPFEGDLVGSLCTPADVLVRRIAIEELGVGDILAFDNVGAYGLTASLIGFLGHDSPVELAVDGGRVGATRLSLGRGKAGALHED